MSIHPESFKSDLEQVTNLDIAKYSLFPIVTHRHNSRVSSSPTTTTPGPVPVPAAVVPERFDELMSTYTARSGLDKREKDRIQHDTQRLVLDLVLSRTVVHSEDPQALTTPPQRAGSNAVAIETPEDLFQRTQDLTLDEQPKIEFRHLIPRETFDETQADSSRQVQPPDKDPKAHLQSSSARQLLGEWQIGSDPSEYIWSGWRDTSTQSQSQVPTPHRRPVRPLPSPRAPQRAAQSQPTLGRYVPEIPPTHAPTFALPPTVRPLTFQPTANTNARSSPPPVLQSSQAYPDIGPSTQVERGPFGGRLETKARKKPAKKRVGGF